jgi:vancomycin permeability regulator SanA
VRYAALVGLAVLIGFLVVNFFRVTTAANDAIGATATGDAIVVLGAAQYNGQPSPVFESRLSTAYDLWNSGAAPLIVTTGANQPGDQFTEGFAGFRYLRNRGVSEVEIVVVTDGGDTYESLLATKLQLGDTTGRVILVTDAYHAKRSSEIAEEVGLTPTVVAAGSDTGFGRRLRESVAVALGEIISFRRLSRLTG